MKNIFIMGDSYSTYKGYIPDGYGCYYSESRTEAPIVKGVEKTWWHMLVAENNLNLLVNDSYSGATVCTSVRENHTIDVSFVKRMDKYVSENFFTENKVDTMLVFGGTNDSWINCPIGELKFSDWTEEDLKNVLPAFCYVISKAKGVADDVLVIINTKLKEEIVSGIIGACEHIGVKHLVLENIDKENGHPTELGMKQICEQVASAL
ncbi:MAG: hypothetical protein IKU61_00180 [Clostridia bacterium]|nr:hypothetical protein [Clostridia bacterium]